MNWQDQRVSKVVRLLRGIALMGIALIGIALIGITALSAAPAIKFSEVVSIEDLTAEIPLAIDEIERSLISEESFEKSAAKSRRLAVQLAIFAQALTEHDQDSSLKSRGPAVRDAAIQFSQTQAYPDARRHFESLKGFVDGEGSAIAKIEYDWSQLGSPRLLMDAMRDRSDVIRKGLRRPKDPVFESRQAAMMAVLALAIDEQANRWKNAEERPFWHSVSRDLQRSLTQTAQAIRSQDGSAALQNFTAAHAACDRCHEKLKR